MGAARLIGWSLVLTVFVASPMAAAQEPSTQKLFESGNWAAVAERAGSGSSEDRYLAGLAHLKAGNAEAALHEMHQLRDQGSDEGWKAVGASAAAMLQHDDGEAVAAGRRATEQSGDNPYAHYQLGLAAAGANDFDTSARAFVRATELKPDFAYAHYYAGQTLHKQRNLGKAADHYQYFLQLAPESPDRAAVLAIMRALRG
jgi:tetratricopeptide (TPR) repeat protein